MEVRGVHDGISTWSRIDADLHEDRGDNRNAVWSGKMGNRKEDEG